MTRFILALALMAGFASAASAQQTYICIKTATGCQVVDSTHGIPTAPATVTAGAGTIVLALVTGGTAQTLVTASTTPLSCMIRNPATATGQGLGTAENAYIRMNGTAEAESGTRTFTLYPGDALRTGPQTGALSWIAATTGHLLEGDCW